MCVYRNVCALVCIYEHVLVCKYVCVPANVYMCAHQVNQEKLLEWASRVLGPSML